MLQKKGSVDFLLNCCIVTLWMWQKLSEWLKIIRYDYCIDESLLKAFNAMLLNYSIKWIYFLIHFAWAILPIIFDLLNTLLVYY